MANKIEVNSKNYESMKALAQANRNAGIPAPALEKAIADYERNVLNSKAEKEFAEFVLSVVADRTGNNLAWSGEPIFLINAHANNTSFGGEVLEVLNGYSMQGIEYIAVNKYKRNGEYYASAIYLPCDFFIKNGELWINDIYKATGAVPHHYKKYDGTLTDGTQVSDLRTYDNSKKWQDEERKRLAKNQKLSEIASNK